MPRYVRELSFSCSPARRANGSGSNSDYCNDMPWQNWIVTKGSTKIQLHGTELCLDAGDDHVVDGAALQTRLCADIPSQRWYVDEFGFIRLDGQAMCLDIP